MESLHACGRFVYVFDVFDLVAPGVGLLGAPYFFGRCFAFLWILFCR